MSILRYFNKHQGWHNGKRTPFNRLDIFGTVISPERIAYEEQLNADFAAREAEAARYAAENPFEFYLPQDIEQYTDNGTLIESPSYKAKLIAEKDTNPNAYYGAAANQLSDIIFDNWSRNKNELNQSFINDLETIKQINPNAYYNAQLKYLGRRMGWELGQNRSDRNVATEQEIRNMIPDAIKSGISPEQIDSIVGKNINDFRSLNQQRIANEASTGGGGFSFTKDILPGLTFVGGSALAMTGLGAALAGGVGGAGAAGLGAIDSTAAALGGSAGGGAFLPAAGSGASFVLPGFASSVAPLTTAEILSSSGFTPTTGSSFAIDPTAIYTTGIGAGTSAPLQGPTYQELGVTGLEAGQAGPTYGELGYTGLNQAEAIAAADAAAKGTNVADVLKNVNQVRQGVNTANNLAKLLGGSTGAAKSATFANSANGLNALASLLRPTPQTSDYLGQIKANQNPFTFTSPGQTVASQGMYDVSGSNIANALRKA
jgi:hypothetical protein